MHKRLIPTALMHFNVLKQLLGLKRINNDKPRRKLLASYIQVWPVRHRPRLSGDPGGKEQSCLNRIHVPSTSEAHWLSCYIFFLFMLSWVQKKKLSDYSFDSTLHVALLKNSLQTFPFYFKMSSHLCPSEMCFSPSLPPSFRPSLPPAPLSSATVYLGWECRLPYIVRM